MPIYAYRCSNCGHAQDVLQRMSDPVLSVCPACAQPTYVKQVTAAGFQLKGSGWYVTDFRGDKKTGAPAEAEPAGAKGDAAAAGADKPAEKGGDGAATGATAKAESKNGEAGKKPDAGPAPAPAPAAASPAPSAAPATPGKTGS